VRLPAAVGLGANEDDAKWQYRDVLLEFDAAIHRNKDIVLTAHAAQQLAVLDADPTAARYRVYSMAAKFCREVDG
jgi:hypothetical protein